MGASVSGDMESSVGVEVTSASILTSGFASVGVGSTVVVVVGFGSTGFGMRTVLAKFFKVYNGRRTWIITVEA